MTESEKRNDNSLSRYQKPANLSLEDWQVKLRREYGRNQNFRMENIGSHPFFSEFQVANPESGNTYRVAIRGMDLGVNYCSCPDFATNHLGTCKHLEWTLAQLEKLPGGTEALQEGFQPQYSEVFLHYGAQREVRFLPGIECPYELIEESEKYFDSRGTLQRKMYAEVHHFLEQGYSLDHDFRCYDDALQFIAEVRDEETRQRQIDEAFPLGADSPAFDTLLKAPLYRYQKEGALFAARAGRSLIGDEMGLGKTVEAIAAAEIMRRLFDVAKVLVICPTSLKHQWEREIVRFADLSATVIQGTPEKRIEQYADSSFYKITNYDVIHTDLEAIEELSPDLVILDEAQRIKNWETRTARVVKKIASPYCIVLTGTPLESRLEELVSIVQFIDQHRLGPTYRFLHQHQKRDGGGKVIGYRNLEQVGETLQPVLLRRKKSQVQEQLPERLIKQYFVPMTGPQMKIHEEQREVVARIAQKWRRNQGRLPEADQRRLMVALQNMRMVCDSTWLLDQRTDHSVKPDELITVLEELLEQPETKVVIFSQWVRMLELIARRIEARKWEHVLFHGALNTKQRREQIDRFLQEPDCRLFLSSDAGQLGLNLQVACVVINLDLPWNPAVMEQRIGRVHRLGQNRAVQVINFIAEGTIEAGMLPNLAYKQSVCDSVLDAGESDLFLETDRLGQFMETVQQVTGHLPPAQRPRQRLAEEPAPPPAPGPTPMVIATPTALPSTSPAPETPAPPALPATAAWQAFIEQGVLLLEQLAANPPSRPKPKANRTLFDELEPAALPFPLPDRHTLERASQALRKLLENWPD